MSVTIIFGEEDALSGECARRLLDRIVFERAVGWLRDQWEPSQRATARSFIPLDANRFPHIAPRSGLKGSAMIANKWTRIANAQAQQVVGDVALLIARDSDHRPIEHRTRTGVDAALEDTVPLAVVVAEATPEFDAWVLMGHEPDQTHEHEALRQLKGELAFDPRMRPHDLNSTSDSQRDAKRLCQRALCLSTQAGAEHPRVLDALDAPVTTLMERGRLAGFPEFVKDIDERLLPLLGDHSRSQRRT